MAASSDTSTNVGDRIGNVSDWYHVPVLLVIVAFMFWSRIRSWGNFVREDGGFYLAAIDSYYHWRTTVYSIEHWPNTMPFDVWTAWPDGRYVGQFGTAFDQLIATLALIVGLGNPSATEIHQTILVAIPLLAALVAVPVYFIGKRLGGRLAGLAGAGLLALFPGTFFTRTAAGQHQHHVAEVLFMAIAILAFMAALRMAEREKPVFEQVVDHDVRGLTPTIVASTLAGTALALYQLMWPPGVVLVGIVGVFFVVYLSLEYLLGRSPEHLAFVGVISMGVAGIIMLAHIETISHSPTSFGYISPLLAFGVAAGCVFMGWLAREWDRRTLSRRGYAVTVGASVIAFVVVLWIVLPNVTSQIVGNLERRLLPVGATVTDLTIQEAQPPSDYSAEVFAEFGLGFYTALLGLIGLILAPLFGRRGRAEHGLIVVWSLFIISMSMTQIRFFYYLAIVVAVLNAYIIGLVVDWADVEQAMNDVSSIEGHQVLVLVTVLMILVVPLMPPVAQGPTVAEAQIGPQGATLDWEESLMYLQHGTPAVGEWGGENNALEYYGTHSIPTDGGYEYPPGSYGVLSWWDYGHLITVIGERIPHSNPFQTNARSSSAFLLAESETRANLILDALPADEGVHDKSNEELAAIVDEMSADQQQDTRYVMIDHAMAGGKFAAISDWSGPPTGTYFEQSQYEIEGQTLPGVSDAYRDTMLSSLYLDDAQGSEHYRLVHENDNFAIVGGMFIPVEHIGVQPQYSLRLTDLGIPGGWGNLTEQLQTQLRTAQFTGQVVEPLNFPIWDGEVVSTVKTFERVEGATITGQINEEHAGPNATAYVEVGLVSNADRQFSYSQNVDVADDGSFALNVSYATNDELGVEDGYTDSQVSAIGNYSVIVASPGDDVGVEYEGEIAVPETAIVEGETIEVELEEISGDDDEENDGDDNEEETDEQPEDSNDTDEE